MIPTRVGLSLELSVGLMLILLGIWNLAGFMKSVPSPETAAADTIVHSHPHRHGELIHTHTHVHSGEEHTHSLEHTPIPALDRTLGRSGAYQFVRPLLVGIVHGLAGSAAVALLILATIRNSTWAIAYLLVFGVGTIAGMMVITVSLVSTFRFVGRRFEKFGQRLALVSGLISLGFGMLLAYQICVVQGLFSGNPQWTPR